MQGIISFVPGMIQDIFNFRNFPLLDGTNCRSPLPTENTFSISIAILIARVFLGVLFFFQGYEKLFVVKIKGVVDAFDAPLESHNVTRSFLYIAATYTSVVEFICGILLIAGLFKIVALSLLGIDLILVAAAFGLIKPMWDMQFVFPRLLLVLLLLILPLNLDHFSLDAFFFIK